jgi:hypothetical protein
MHLKPVLNHLGLVLGGAISCIIFLPLIIAIRFVPYLANPEKTDRLR